MVQLSGGMIQTGMRNLDSWGFYITLFMFFVGLSAGGLIISSIPNAFGMKGFGDISRVAIWTSICCTCVAIGFVVVDLGGPLRLWELFVYSNLSSPLMWDIIVLSTYLILSIVYLWAYRREDAGKMSHTAIRVISIIALVVAVGVHTVTAWIFSLSAAHEFWHTALMGPVVCGFGAGLRHGARAYRGHRLAEGRASYHRALLHGEPGEDARGVHLRRSVFLRLRSADERFPRRRGCQCGGDAGHRPLGAVLLDADRLHGAGRVILFVPRLRTRAAWFSPRRS